MLRRVLKTILAMLLKRVFFRYSKSIDSEAEKLTKQVFLSKKDEIVSFLRQFCFSKS